MKSAAVSGAWKVVSANLARFKITTIQFQDSPSLRLTAALHRLAASPATLVLLVNIGDIFPASLAYLHIVASSILCSPLMALHRRHCDDFPFIKPPFGHCFEADMCDLADLIRKVRIVATEPPPT